MARSFIEECRNFKEHEYHVIQSEMLSDLIDVDEYPENFSFYTIGYRPATRVLSFRSQDKDLKNIEEKVQPDVVFTTSGPAYWRPKTPHVVGYNLPHYIYRDSPYFSQIPFAKRLKWDLKGAVLKAFFKRDADAYIVQTEDVNQRLRSWLQSENVYSVSNTYSQHYDDPKSVANKLPERKPDEFRFLSLSAWYAHKNLNIIPKVVDLLPDHIKSKVRFILTLPEDLFQEHFDSKRNGKIINIGPVKPEEGPALYKECNALFLPTLLECFSASYAEAMKMEKPIITSDLGFAHTVCKEAALYADPVNPDEISQKIIELIENPDLRKELIHKGKKQLNTFVTAQKRAEEYLRICGEFADGKRN